MTALIVQTTRATIPLAFMETGVAGDVVGQEERSFPCAARIIREIQDANHGEALQRISVTVTVGLLTVMILAQPVIAMTWNVTTVMETVKPANTPALAVRPIQ